MTSADSILAVVGRKAGVGAIAIVLVAVAVVTGFSIGPLLSPVPLVFAAYAVCRPHSKEAARTAAGLALVVALVALVLAYGGHVTVLAWLLVEAVLIVVGLVVDVVLIVSGVWPERERAAIP